MSKRPLEDASLELRSQLAQILGRDVALVGKIRKTDEPSLISIYDVIMNITGCVGKNGFIIWKRLLDAFPEVHTKCMDLKFPGRGQRDTPVAPIETIVDREHVG